MTLSLTKQMDEKIKDWNRFVMFYKLGKMTKEELEAERAKIWGAY
jgi:hypothetical protein